MSDLSTTDTCSAGQPGSGGQASSGGTELADSTFFAAGMLRYPVCPAFFIQMSSGYTASDAHGVRVRTITCFVTLPPLATHSHTHAPADTHTHTEATSVAAPHNEFATWQAILDRALAACKHAQRALAAAGVEVQTLRVVTQPFAEYLQFRTHTHTHTHAHAHTHTSSDTAVSAPRAPFDDMDVDDVVAQVAELELCVRRAASKACDCRAATAVSSDTKIDEKCHCPPILVSIGAAHTRAHVWLAGRVIPRTAVAATAIMPPAPDGVIDAEFATECARTIAYIGAHTESGFGNFRFGVSAHPAAFTPFFPAAFHSGDAGGVEAPLPISIGLQHVEACARASKDVQAGTHSLEAALARCLESPVQEIMGIVQAALHSHGRCRLVGVDTSLAPAPLPDASLMLLYRACGVAHFGAPGSVEVSARLTRVLKTFNIGSGARAGYCGLMLPPMEDVGLAADADSGRYGITQLLLCSAVCGVGLDTVPVPGDVSEDAVAGLLRDVAAMAFRLSKPLSVRLFPVPKLRAGERTAFDSPYLCNTSVFEV